MQLNRIKYILFVMITSIYLVWKLLYKNIDSYIYCIQNRTHTNIRLHKYTGPVLESTVLGTVFSFIWLRLEQSRCDMFLSFPGTTLIISLRWICLVQSLAIPCNPDQGPAKREECRLPFQRFFFLEGLPASHCQRPHDFWGLSTFQGEYCSSIGLKL